MPGLSNSSTYYAILYRTAKGFVCQHPRLLRFVRKARFIGRLGPWRNLIIGYLKRYTHNQPLPILKNTLFPELDIDHVADSISRLGCWYGEGLSETYVDDILEYYKNKNLKAYEDPHNECELVRNIVYDPKIVEIARRYLEAEPILYRSSIYRSKGAGIEVRSFNTKRKDFHYDVGDFKSLTIFIYLTDVDADCGPHVLIENTRMKTFNQLLNPSISYEVAIKQYEERIKVVTGRRGTIIFEDITTFHQHEVGQKPRLVLTISYMLHRRPEWQS